MESFNKIGLMRWRHLDGVICAFFIGLDARRVIVKTMQRCNKCGNEIGKDQGPPDGWQLEDGTTVCHSCCADDTKRRVRGDQ